VLRVVDVGPDSICCSTSIGVLGSLPGRDGGHSLLRPDSHVGVHLLAVLITGLVPRNPGLLNIVGS